MQNNTDLSIKKYFAASNTYGGFVSYFDEVFPTEEFDRIYVLKGGPGTGKSSFMRKIAEHFTKNECEVEEVYCSSDPRSLDGIIISYNSKKIAILDGTAPHERDAKIPGAFDEIINLADSLDTGWLTAKREEILSLAREKSNAYSTAYSYLEIAGKAKDFLHKIYKTNFDIFKAKSKAECILQEIPTNDSGRIVTRLICSFGRLGEHRLSTLSELKIKLITVGGDEESTDLFLDYCYELIKARNPRVVHLPCALDPAHTDAIYLPDCKLAILRIDSDKADINSNEITHLPPIAQEQIRVAKQMKYDAQAEARRWFTIASDLHFRLEEIYGRAMDFEKNNKIIEQKFTEISNILEIPI